MPRVDRNSKEDSRKITELFLRDDSVRLAMLKFLAESINYANQLNSENWNLNLDKNGRFIRFNVGHEYCIEIFKNKVHILCLKKSLNPQVEGKNLEIDFKGYIDGKQIISKDMNSVPDVLSKVPDSIGCHFRHDKIIEYLPLIKESHKKFIEYGVLNTTQIPVMRKAHSLGYLDYLNELGMFSDLELITENEYEEIRISEQKEAKKIDEKSLRKRAKQAKILPQKTIVSVTKYIRNQYIVEYAKRKANGICQDCFEPAPFINKNTGEPFLETHHIIPLAEGGEDTIENTIAICPNCHRKRHYG